MAISRGSPIIAILGALVTLSLKVLGVAATAAATAATSAAGNFTQNGTELIDSMEKCVQRYADLPLGPGLTYCGAAYDTFLCWPPTLAGRTVFQHCPEARLSDTTQLAFRRCGNHGLWLGRRRNESDLIGWTNYTPCFPDELRGLLGRVYDDQSDPQIMFQIAQNTRYMEIIGFSLSLIALLISLYIFGYFRALRNVRTRIHRHLFLAMVLQVLVRLALYLDQAFLRDRGGLDRLPYVCEACYVALEFGVSAMFCWMFIEGLYLHGVVTARALRPGVGYRRYRALGWAVAAALTVAWAALTAAHYRRAAPHQCWYGYNFLPQYWVCQAPRLAIILINLVFLLNIVRVLVGKLNRGPDSELEKARKAARAALVLLPLLGTTNLLNMLEPPLAGPGWRFALWSYSTHFLRSFQGLFIALIYCFLNGEVRQQVSKLYRDWRSARGPPAGRAPRRGESSSLPLRSARGEGSAGGAGGAEPEPLAADNAARLPFSPTPRRTERCDEETRVTDSI